MIEWYKEISIWSYTFYLPCWGVTGIWSTLQQSTCSGGKVNWPHGHLFPEMKSNEPIRPWHFWQYNLPLFQHPYKKTINNFFKRKFDQKEEVKIHVEMYLLHSKAVLTCISTEPPHVQVIHVHVPIKKCLQTFWSHDSPHRYYIHVNPLRHILSINRKSHLSQSLINPLRSAIWFTRQKPLSWQYIRCCWANWICKKHLHKMNRKIILS